MNELEMTATYLRKNMFKLIDQVYERNGVIRIIKDSNTKVVLISFKEYSRLKGGK